MFPGRMRGNRSYFSRIVRLPIIAGAIVGGWLALTVVPPWIMAYTPIVHAGAVITGVLRGIMVVYGLAIAMGVVGMAWLGLAVVRDRRRGQAARRVKLLALCISCLIGVGLTEGLARAFELWIRPLVPTANRTEAKVNPYPTNLAEGPPGGLRIVVLGESSAVGVPFEPRLSVGQILAWQLGKILPDRRVEAEILASPGAPLEGMHKQLYKLKRRPDVVLIYSGHNEFQARFAWSRDVNYYDDDVRPKPGPPPWVRVTRYSAVCRMALDAIEARKISIPPPPRVTRELIDRPCCSRAEYDEVLALFRRRLEGMVSYAETIGALPVLIIPPGNDGRFDPSRSTLSPSTPEAARKAFARDFLAVRTREGEDAAHAIAAYRALLERQPGFAEAHFRLAGLLERGGETAEANRHYQSARDLDGMPMRCPTAFQDIYREIAARHPDALLIDGPEVFRRLDPTGVLGDVQFHDAHHPTLRGHAALAQAVLDGLHAKKSLGWPQGTASPVITPAECQAHFGIDRAAWIACFEGSATFYNRTAYIRFDPSDRLFRRDRYRLAATRVKAGTPPAQAGVPGLDD
ncbi:MAG: hypothetical protein JWN86_2683 [Planctomycetota bacterium]|nr:hypothetical protein [Planctomycetota bacterium]